MSALAAPAPATPVGTRGALRHFFVQEYLRIMRSRVAILIWLLIAYALVVVPFMMQRPQPELLLALESWLGSEAIHSKAILFVWVDASMNKFAVILGPALAGGIIADERARGMLDVVASKPMTMADYFSVKLAAAAAALATFYLAGVFGALLTFPWRVTGFDAGAFVALSAVHLFAALFAVSFAGAMATVFRNKLTGMLVSVCILGTLVGLAFLGFYYPEFRTASYLNPFFDGILPIGVAPDFTAWDILFPILLLVAFNLVFAGIGRRRAAGLLESGERTPGRPDKPIDAGIPVARRPAHNDTPFASLLRTEMAGAIGRRHVVALASLCLMGLTLAFWLPTFPASIRRFFEQVFGLDGWPQIVVANDFAGLFFFIYWVGVFDVLAIYVVPLEERQLDIYLSKPLTRREYLFAKVIPPAVTMIGLGIVSAAACWFALAAAGLSYDPLAYAAAAAAIPAAVVLLVSIVNLAVLGAREIYSALLIAFVPIAVSILPSMIYMYRPDVFAGVPTLRDLIIFPMNLVWFPDFSRHWGFPLAATLLAIAAGLVTIAGWRIERRDVG
jgi:ABC-type transport system involved in multi-copper enzyme maturation permease subunit